MEKGVQLVHGHQPAYGDALLGSVAEAGLAAGGCRLGQPVGTGLMGLHGVLGSDEGAVLHHGEAVGIGGVVLDANHTAGYPVEGVVRLPAQVRSVGGVGVHIYIVPVIDAQVPGRLGIYMELPVPYPRCPLVHPVGVAGVGRPDEVPVGHRPRGMDGVARLGGSAVEAEALGPQRVPAPLYLRPPHLEVGYMAGFPVQSSLQHLPGETIAIGADVGVSADDDIGQVGGGFGPFPVDDEVLPVLDDLVLIVVGVKPAGRREEGQAIVDLLVEGDPGIGAEEHQGGSGLPVFSCQNVLDLVPPPGGGGIQEPLDVDLGALFQGELPVVPEAAVTDDIRQLGRQLRHDEGVVLGIVDGLDAPLPYLKEGVGAGGGDLMGLHLQPGVGGQVDVGILHRGGDLYFRVDDAVNQVVAILDELVAPLGVVDQVDIGGPDELGRCGEVGLPGEHLPAVLGGVDDEGTVAVRPVAHLLIPGVGYRFDVLAVGGGVQVGMEGVLGYPALEPWPRILGALEEGRLVVAGPGVHPGAGPADVTGKHHGQVEGAVNLRGVEVVVHPLPMVDCHRLDGGYILGQAEDELPGGAGNLGYRFQVVVLEMDLVHLKERHHLYLFTV